MGCRDDLGQRDARVQLDPHGRHGKAAVSLAHERGRDGGGRGRTRLVAHHRRRDVARREGQRKDQPEAAIDPLGLIQVAQLHDDPVAGTDVGHLGGEEVGPRLFDQGGALSALARRLVGAAGLRLLLHDRDDAALAHDDHHGVHRRGLGQREDIDRLDHLVGGVGEELRDGARDQRSVHLQHDVGAHRRQRHQPVVAAPQQLAAAHGVHGDGLVRPVGGRGERGDGQQQDDPCELRSRSGCRHDALLL